MMLDNSRDGDDGDVESDIYLIIVTLLERLMYWYVTIVGVIVS